MENKITVTDEITQHFYDEIMQHAYLDKQGDLHITHECCHLDRDGSDILKCQIFHAAEKLVHPLDKEILDLRLENRKLKRIINSIKDNINSSLRHIETL